MRVRSSAVDRLEFILQGRKPFPWAQSVALSKGAMQRLRAGGFPDPEKLVPACRVENISLTWWLDGIGAPYVVYIAADGNEHTELARQMLSDEPDLQPVLVEHSERQYAAFVQVVESVSTEGAIYKFRSVTMIGGVPADSAYLVGLMRNAGAGDVAREIAFNSDQVRRFATGQMGSYEFLQLFDEQSKPLRSLRASFYDQAAKPGRHLVQEEFTPMFDLPPPQDHDRSALLDAVTKISEPEAEMLERMIRGLLEPKD